MNKRISMIVVITMVVLAALVLSSCERSASKAPVATPTLNLPVTTQAQSVIEAEDLSEQATKEAAETAEDDVEVIEEEAAEEEVEATAVPEPTATPEPEVPEVTRPETYALQAGEWPICIARRFDLDLGSFFSLNGLGMDSRPATGTVLKIPADGSWSVASYGERALKSHPTTYTVKNGDTIYTVACHFGDVAPEQIAAVNSLEAPYTLTAGQELQIP
jgi:LysM repeat protein